MATEKKSAKKSTNSKTVKKNNNSGKAEKQVSALPEPFLTRKAKAWIYIALTFVSVIILLFKGKVAWQIVRGFLFGTLGFAIFLLPFLFAYLTFLNVGEKNSFRLKGRTIFSIIFIVSMSIIIYLSTGSPHSDMSYFKCLGNLYRDLYSSDFYFPVGAGIFGGILGYPFSRYVGFGPTLSICIFVIVVSIFIILNISVHDIGMFFTDIFDSLKYKKEQNKEQKKIMLENYERYVRQAKLEQEEEELPEIIENPANDINNKNSKLKNKFNRIDIPLEITEKNKIGKKFRNRKLTPEEFLRITGQNYSTEKSENDKNSGEEISNVENTNGSENTNANLNSTNQLKNNTENDTKKETELPAEVLDIINRANQPMNINPKLETENLIEGTDEDVVDNENITNQSANEVTKDLDDYGDGYDVPFEESNNFEDVSNENDYGDNFEYQNYDENNYEKENTKNIVEKEKTTKDNFSKAKNNKFESSNDDEMDIEEQLSKYSYSVDSKKDHSEKSEKEEIKYHFPPIQLLTLNDNSNDRNALEEMQNNAKKLIETLDSFNVKASIVNICRGPSVTRYELQPAPGVKISKITNLSDDIALNLAANGVRIEAPIPGKAAVGIEVPNKVVSMVTMRELIDSDEFRGGKSKLTCVLGKDISGSTVVTDLAKMPHLLIAGTTGSGKSVCVNSILMSILYKANPDEVKLLLIDPKMVEFSKYKNIPHLLIPVVSDAKKAAGALAWAVSEMLQRYKIFSEYDCKNIDAYNDLVSENIRYMADNPPYEDENGEMIQPVMEHYGLPVAKEKMSRIVIAIDELADLMMAAPSEVEESICRLAQMARAAGMHLLIATQRPTVNVITGLIKANIPSRIALKVSSNMDSRTILDLGGAEKLIGRGDMLFSPVGAPKPLRVQGCYASDEEIERVTGFIKDLTTAQYNAEIEEKIKRIAAEEIAAGKKSADDGGGLDGLDVDSKMEEAIKCVIEAGQASTSLLQRRLKVGYARAGRMIDDMEQMGVVGPYQGSKPRDVLLTYNEWLERSQIMGDPDDE